MKQIHKGFTLLEILLVVASIGILASIVIIAINPNRQLAQTRNASRQADTNTIYKAVNQYLIDQNTYPENIEMMGYGFDNRRDICQTGFVSTECMDLGVSLSPNYLARVPLDPQDTGVASSGYSIIRNINNTFAVRAERAELGEEIVTGVVFDSQGENSSNVPDAISDLTSQIVGGNSVQLDWGVPFSPLPILEYVVIYSSGDDFGSQQVITGITNSELLIENLEVGAYQFKVIAVNESAQSPDSNVVEEVICGTGSCIDYGGGDWIISTNQEISGLHYNIGLFRINSGVTVSVTLGERLVVYAQNVEQIGVLNATARGHRGGRDGHTGDGGQGPGGGGLYAGGGHGGAGGFGNAGAAGVQYGSIEEPVELGSGGGRGWQTTGYEGGRGGGAVKIVTSGDIEVAGSIQANGGNGVGSWYAGGGSGGSIWLEAGGELRGAGAIQANGGNGINNPSGGGAGGRIALYYGTSSFSGAVTTNGGTGGHQSGGAGTIWQ